MNKPKVTATIVTHNRLDLLKQTLNLLLDSQGGFLKHILVINNASTDGTEEFLDSLQDVRFIIVHSKENLGGAGGFNAAVKYFITQTDDDFVWLMDDDTFVKADSLEKLVEATKEHPDGGLFASQVRWRGGQWSWMNLMKDANGSFTGTRDGSELIVPIVNSTFVSTMIRRKEILNVGLPQKEYFIWGDDIEYTERIARVSKGYFVRDSIVNHMSAENVKPGDIAGDNDENRLPRYLYEYRNRILTAKRRKSAVKMMKTLGHAGVDGVKTLFSPKTTHRFKKAGIIIRGTWNGFFFNPKVEYVVEK
jgi:GT2 family glycosyltransferase